MDALAQLRSEIDRVDADIVKLLAERMEIARRVAEVKRETGIPVRLPERIAAVIERNAATGLSAGLDADYVRRLYRLVIEETCREEEAMLGEGQVK